MFKSIWKSLDGKKVWTAVIGFVTFYGIPYCRVKWPFLPWDEILIPLLTGIGVVGIGHKVMKAQSADKVSE